MQNILRSANTLNAQQSKSFSTISRHLGSIQGRTAMRMTWIILWCQDSSSPSFSASLFLPYSSFQPHGPVSIHFAPAEKKKVGAMLRIIRRKYFYCSFSNVKMKSVTNISSVHSPKEFPYHHRDRNGLISMIPPSLRISNLFTSWRNFPDISRTLSSVRTRTRTRRRKVLREEVLPFSFIEPFSLCLRSKK